MVTAMKEEPSPEFHRSDDDSDRAGGLLFQPWWERALGWLPYAAMFTTVLLALRAMGLPILDLVPG